MRIVINIFIIYYSTLSCNNEPKEEYKENIFDTYEETLSFIKQGNDEYMRGNYKKAIVFYDKAIREGKLNELKSLALNNIAESYELLEQYDKAIKQYYKIRMLQPNNVISYLLLSEALVAMRRYKELIKILSSIPDIVNQSTQLLNYLGTCHTEFGNSKEAKIFFDKANKLLSEGTKDDR